MLPVVWMESFSEEEETVKQVSSLPNKILFFEPPVQQLDSNDLPDDFIATIRTHSTFDRNTAKKSKCVISRSTGYDHLLDQREVLSDVPVGYLSEYATQAVAEHNLTVTLSLLKDLSRQQRATRRFNRNDLTTSDLHTRQVGVVGIGRIGEATARLFMKLGLPVKGHDVEEKQSLAEHEDFVYCSLERLFESSDVVVLCLPHTDQTEELITPGLLNSMPSGSVLVNSGRGEVVRSQHLLEALESGPLSGIGIDVYNREDELSAVLRQESVPENPDDEITAGLKLIEDDRVVSTPHNAFNSREAVRNKVQRTLENIEKFNESGELLNPVG